MNNEALDINDNMKDITPNRFQTFINYSYLS